SGRPWAGTRDDPSLREGDGDGLLVVRVGRAAGRVEAAERHEIEAAAIGYPSAVATDFVGGHAIVRRRSALGAARLLDGDLLVALARSIAARERALGAERGIGGPVLRDARARGAFEDLAVAEAHGGRGRAVAQRGNDTPSAGAGVARVRSEE